MFRSVSDFIFARDASSFEVMYYGLLGTYGLLESSDESKEVPRTLSYGLLENLPHTPLDVMYYGLLEYEIHTVGSRKICITSRDDSSCNLSHAPRHSQG